jgi:hypothetical protein
MTERPEDQKLEQALRSLEPRAIKIDRQSLLAEASRNDNFAKAATASKDPCNNRRRGTNWATIAMTWASGVVVGVAAMFAIVQLGYLPGQSFTQEKQTVGPIESETSDIEPTELAATNDAKPSPSGIGANRRFDQFCEILNSPQRDDRQLTLLASSGWYRDKIEIEPIKTSSHTVGRRPPKRPTLRTGDFRSYSEKFFE